MTKLTTIVNAFVLKPELIEHHGAFKLERRRVPDETSGEHLWEVFHNDVLMFVGTEEEARAKM